MVSKFLDVKGVIFALMPWFILPGQTVILFVGVLFVHNVSAYVVENLLDTRRLHKRQASDYITEAHPQEMCFTIDHLKALKDQFAGYIDSNGDERASKDEILTYLQHYKPTIKDDQVTDFIARRDKDGDGSVDFIPDYLMEVSSPNFDLNTAREWFDLEDTNGDGFVSRDELISIATRVGMPPEEAERTAMGYYMSADQNNDGQLSWEEYKPLFMM
ncbi:hypothetical protein ACF0H5_020379 [Mactra antiquata]